MDVKTSRVLVRKVDVTVCTIDSFFVGSNRELAS